VADLAGQAADFTGIRTRRGNPYENAVMESFFKTLKQEEVYLYEYETIHDVDGPASLFHRGGL
jgi:transposase InsO family protein